MKFLSALANFLVEFVKLAKNVFVISFIAVLAVFFLTVFMPENVVSAIEIFKKLLKIP